ncbi:MAG TPA: hypothetical protein DEP84_22165 [Chloroflexi bacterium]|nr:hypothetical protein [Chloroflexota bacterium]
MTAPTTRPPLTTPGAAAHTDRVQRLPTVTPRAVATLVIALSQALPASTPVDLSRPAPVAPPRSAVDIVLLVLSSGLVLFGLAAAGGVVWFVLHEPRR